MSTTCGSDPNDNIRSISCELNLLPNLRLLGNKSNENFTLSEVKPTVSKISKVNNIDFAPYYASGKINDMYRETIRSDILSNNIGLFAEYQYMASKTINDTVSKISAKDSQAINTMHIDSISRREIIFLSIMIIIIVLYKYFYGN